MEHAFFAILIIQQISTFVVLNSKIPLYYYKNNILLILPLLPQVLLPFFQS